MVSGSYNRSDIINYKSYYACLKNSGVLKFIISGENCSAEWFGTENWSKWLRWKCKDPKTFLWSETHGNDIIIRCINETWNRNAAPKILDNYRSASICVSSVIYDVPKCHTLSSPVLYIRCCTRYKISRLTPYSRNYACLHAQLHIYCIQDESEKKWAKLHLQSGPD